MTTLSDEQVRLNLANLLNDVVADGFDGDERAALRAAIERFTPPQGELGEAVERLESAVLMAESPAGATVTTRDVRVEDIRRVLAEVQRRQEPEADPELVTAIRAETTEVLRQEASATIEDNANGSWGYRLSRLQIIGQVLKERGESNDGKTE